MMLTELNQYFSEIVWVAGPTEEANITDCSFLWLVGLEVVFLNV